MKRIITVVLVGSLCIACGGESASETVDPSSEATGAEPTGAEPTGAETTADETANTATSEPPATTTEEPDPDPEPVPPVEPEYPELSGVALAIDEDPAPGVVEVSLTAAPSEIELIAGVKTQMWTYNGQLPGPVIQARVGDKVIVHLKNELPQPTTIHWHGMRVPNEMDGTPRTQDPVQPGGSFTYEFVVQDAGTFWYHPHFSTHEQVERGLYGVIIVHEAETPKFDVERVVFLDDILLNPAYQIEPFIISHMVQMHGRNGNTLLLNGKAVAGDELLQLRRGTVERWRILNSANARTAYFEPFGTNWSVIGWDGGLIPKSYKPELLRIAPGERYDLEVRWDVTDAGQTGELRYYVPALNEQNQVVLAPIVLTTVMSNGLAELEYREPELPEITLPELVVDDTATLTLEFSGANVGGTVEWMINGKTFEKAAAIDVPLGTHHTIDLVNTQAQEHPFHIHGHFFRVVSRNGVAEKFDGLKDTVYVGGDETVRLVMDFDNPGGWMAHCHILEHAELGMMALFEVLE